MPGYSPKEAKILKKFGSAVRDKRKGLNLSQEELAERAGLHRNYVGGVEQGRRNLSLLNIVKIAKALNAAPGQFFEN